MPPETTLVLPYFNTNRYSVHALAGALDINKEFDDLAILFPRREQQVVECMKELLQGQTKILLAVSFSSYRRAETADMIRAIRKLRGDTKNYLSPPPRGRLFLLAGGPHPSALPQDVLEMGFDAAVRGEGEAVFPQLTRAILQGQDWRSIPGIAYLDGHGQVQKNAPPSPIDLNAYPPFSPKRGLFGHIEITRGCPHSCGFCQISQLHGPHPRHRSVANILQHIHSMRNAGCRDYRFITPNAFAYASPDGRLMNYPALENLLRGIREAVGDEDRIWFGSFPSEVRPEHVTDQTVALVRHYANNDNLVVGAQSGSDRILKKCRRGHSAQDAHRAVQCILRGGLKANVDFIFGLPGETQDDLEATLDMMYELIDSGARIHAHTFLPVPQTPFGKAPPGKISDRLREKLHQLVHTGSLYGNWNEQESLANQYAAQ